MGTTEKKSRANANGAEELSREQEAVRRAIAASEGLSVTRRAKAVARVLSTLWEQELDLELMLVGNRKGLDDPYPSGGPLGVEWDEEHGAATAKVTPDRERPMERVEVRCTSYQQRLDQIHEALADLEENCAPTVWDVAKRLAGQDEPEK